MKEKKLIYKVRGRKKAVESAVTVKYIIKSESMFLKGSTYRALERPGNEKPHRKQQNHSE